MPSQAKPLPEHDVEDVSTLLEASGRRFDEEIHLLSGAQGMGLPILVNRPTAIGYRPGT